MLFGKRPIECLLSYEGRAHLSGPKSTSLNTPRDLIFSNTDHCFCCVLPFRVSLIALTMTQGFPLLAATAAITCSGIFAGEQTSNRPAVIL